MLIYIRTFRFHLMNGLRQFSHIFRAYDIRGIFNKELTPEVMARIGSAVGSYAPSPYAVGGDTRGSTPVLKTALIAGLLSAGVDVYDIGTTPIGAALYSTLRKGLGMAYVTGSHLPPEWNGVKLSRPGGDLMVGRDIYSIREIFLEDERISRSSHIDVGRRLRMDVLPEYVLFLKKKARGGSLRIVVDCGNGAASLVVPALLRDLGHEVYAINCDVDPRFPARGSEPEPEKLGELSRSIKDFRADFGVAFDGDGDRTLFFDERGRPLTAEQAAVVMLEGGGRGDVVANVECSMMLEEYVRSYGGRIFWVPVGRTFMIKELNNRGAILGVESSGHYVVWRNYNMDDGILTLLYFAEAVHNLGREISEVVPRTYPQTKIRIKVDDRVKFALIEKLREKMLKEYGKVDTTDGIRVDLGRGWTLIRPSNTEPLIRITVEAYDEKLLKKLRDNFEKLVRETAKEMAL